MTPISLTFRRLRYSYGPHTVLDGVSGKVEPRQLLLVGGANGIGKSTLIRCLAGLQREQSGDIEFLQEGVTLDREERRTKVGWIGPDLSFYEDLSAKENLAFFSRLRGLSATRGYDLLERLGVPGQRRAGALSSGMLQRLRWAFALQHLPPILLLDEPFQNLDDAGERATQALLSDHLTTGGLAVVASPVDLPVPATHRLQLTAGVGDTARAVER